MRRSWVIHEEWVAKTMDLISSKSSTLKEIQDYLDDIGLAISMGEIRAVLTGLCYLGIVDHKTTRKKVFRYHMHENNENKEFPKQ